MMNNENLKPVNVENNQESLLLEKIRELEEENEELKRKNRKLEENVAELNVDLMHDPLTGLKTRRYLAEMIEETISSLESPERERRAEGYSTFSLLFCDLDKFKEVNDIHGHNGGDDVLKKVSEIINDSVRTTDIVCRWSGDEIVIGLMGADKEEAAKIGEKIRSTVEEKMKDTGVTVSVGAGGDHPSLTEHHVRYIALYLNTAEIARVYLHPIYSFPRVTFTIALDEGGMLRAIAEPTHSAGWEASKKITVVP